MPEQPHQSAVGPDPDIAFAIFEDAPDAVAYLCGGDFDGNGTAACRVSYAPQSLSERADPELRLRVVKQEEAATLRSA